MIIKDVRILKDKVNIVIEYDSDVKESETLIISSENVIKNHMAIQKLRELADGDFLEIFKKSIS